MTHLNIKKILLSLVFVSLAIVAIGGWLDDKGKEYADVTFNRALVAFGIAKGLNGVISVAQGTEVALEPAGIGVNFTPGQILDPINDLIEQFSWVMLASTASIGVQKILLAISVWPWFTGFVILLLSLVVISYWYVPLEKSHWRPLLVKAMLVFVFLRFSVPIIAIGSEVIYAQFLSSQYIESTQELNNTTDKISSINTIEEKNIVISNDKTMWQSAKEWYGTAAAAMNISQRIEQYKTASADATRHAINLIVVFIFQTILFPLAFLTVIYQLLKRLVKLDWMVKI